MLECLLIQIKSQVLSSNVLSYLIYHKILQYCLSIGQSLQKRGSREQGQGSRGAGVKIRSSWNKDALCLITAEIQGTNLSNLAQNKFRVSNWQRVFFFFPLLPTSSCMELFEPNKSKIFKHCIFCLKSD